jgi:7,8-dihydro-6-hydroxymethylpterin-pyrophosphokinase
LEGRAGRAAGTHQQPRELDIDLLLFGTRVLDDAGLVVPHPRMRRRRFVLEPMAEIEPDLKLPPDGRPVAELLADPKISGQDLHPDVRIEPGSLVGQEGLR